MPRCPPRTAATKERSLVTGNIGFLRHRNRFHPKHKPKVPVVQSCGGQNEKQNSSDRIDRCDDNERCPSRDGSTENNFGVSQSDRFRTPRYISPFKIHADSAATRWSLAKSSAQALSCAALHPRAGTTDTGLCKTVQCGTYWRRADTPARS